MLGPRGMHTAFRLISQASRGRSIHIPAALRKPPPLPKDGGAAARNAFNQARHALNKLIYGGNALIHTTTFTRATHFPPIRSQLSFTARHALSSGGPKLPNAPFVQRGITQVGLGSAKKFSTARPIFQNLVENVPIALRTGYEMDIDVNKKKGKKLAARKFKKENKVKKTREMIKSKPMQETYERYFAEMPESQVSTQLIVPLSPSDSVSVSVPASVPTVPTSGGPSLIPGRAIMETHSAHTTHALRISSLFLRLDQGRVWERGAHYEAFGLAEDGQRALCTTLRVVFDGWTEEMVRDVIGEAGQGWCVLREIRRTPNAPMSLESSRVPTPAPVFDMGMSVDPLHEHEFVMPTLDFSSSFIETRAATPFADMVVTPAESIWSSALPSPRLENNISLPSTRAPSFYGESDAEEEEWHWSDSSSSASSRRAPEFVSVPPSSEAWRSVDFSAAFMRRGQELMSPF